MSSGKHTSVKSLCALLVPTAALKGRQTKRTASEHSVEYLAAGEIFPSGAGGRTLTPDASVALNVPDWPRFANELSVSTSKMITCQGPVYSLFQHVN